MSKWTCTVIQNTDTGKYRAFMDIDGKSVEGLPFDVGYNILRQEIKNITHKEILKRKDMAFERLSDFEIIATIDATQTRNDCRVTLAERINGWKPYWD